MTRQQVFRVGDVIVVASGVDLLAEEADLPPHRVDRHQQDSTSALAMAIDPEAKFHQASSTERATSGK